MNRISQISVLSLLITGGCSNSNTPAPQSQAPPQVAPQAQVPNTAPATTSLSKAVIGKWEGNDGSVDINAEFRSDGTFTKHFSFSSKPGSKKFEYTHRWTVLSEKDNVLAISIEHGAAVGEAKLQFQGPREFTTLEGSFLLVGTYKKRN